MFKSQRSRLEIIFKKEKKNFREIYVLIIHGAIVQTRKKRMQFRNKFFLKRNGFILFKTMNTNTKTKKKKKFSQTFLLQKKI